MPNSAHPHVLLNKHWVKLRQMDITFSTIGFVLKAICYDFLDESKSVIRASNPHMIWNRSKQGNILVILPGNCNSADPLREILHKGSHWQNQKWLLYEPNSRGSDTSEMLHENYHQESCRWDTTQLSTWKGKGYKQALIMTTLNFIKTKLSSQKDLKLLRQGLIQQTQTMILGPNHIDLQRLVLKDLHKFWNEMAHNLQQALGSWNEHLNITIFQ